VLHKADQDQFFTDAYERRLGPERMHPTQSSSPTRRWCFCCYTFKRPARHAAVTSDSHELTCYRVASAPFSRCGSITYLR
jgi:hypothetical protein